MNRLQAAGGELARRSIAEHMARQDLLGLYEEGRTKYEKVAHLLDLSKDDIAKIAAVKKSSVRFDDRIPQQVAQRLKEIANIANLVAEYFRGDTHKVALWFDLSNPMLGDMSPRNMIRAGQYKKVLRFILEARDAERAAQTRAAGQGQVVQADTAGVTSDLSAERMEQSGS